MTVRPVRVPISALGSLLAVIALTSCGPGTGTDRWARATADSCTSTLARSGLRVPLGLVDPALFEAERARLLADRSGFNTVQPYRNVCTRLRDEIVRSTSTTTPAPTTASPKSTTAP